jgi:hypothetical protein
VLYSGMVASAAADDTWEWTGSDWVQRLATSGPNVAFGAGFFDAGMQATVLVGGALTGNRATPTDGIWAYAAVNPASFTRFGKGCSGSAGTPAIDGTPPWLGESQTWTVQPVPSASVSLWLLGRSNTMWGSIPLPFDLGGIGAPGCSLAVDAFFVFVMVTAQNTASLTLPWPNDPSLVAAVLHGQGVVVDLPANPAGLVTSDGGTVQVGSK